MVKINEAHASNAYGETDLFCDDAHNVPGNPDMSKNLSSGHATQSARAECFKLAVRHESAAAMQALRCDPTILHPKELTPFPSYVS